LVADLDRVALVEALRLTGHALGVGDMTVDRNVVALGKLRVGHRMIEVVMRRKDQLDVGSSGVDPSDDGILFGGIDDRGFASFVADHEVGVVIAKGGDALDY